jgi:hypothetical protein
MVPKKELTTFLGGRGNSGGRALTSLLQYNVQIGLTLDLRVTLT